MLQNVFYITCFFSAFGVFSQNTPTEALYYDANGTLYKIERKYSDAKTQTTGYILHDNQKSSCIKRAITLSKDTTIIKESYYRIVEPVTTFEKFSNCDSWVISANNNKDTVVLKGYNHEQHIGDTVLTGPAMEHAWQFSEHLKKIRASLILNEKIIVRMDSLFLYETVYTYYLNQVPIKIQSFDANNIKYSETIGKLSPNKIIYERRFTSDASTTYQIDTITWNKTKTQFVWKSKNLELNLNKTVKYHIVGKVLQAIENDSIPEETTFKNKKTIFHNFLLNTIVYQNNANYMELKHLEREKIVAYKRKDAFITNTMSFNAQKKITEQLTLKNNLLEKKVIYKYNK